MGVVQQLRLLGDRPFIYIVVFQYILFSFVSFLSAAAINIIAVVINETAEAININAEAIN